MVKKASPLILLHQVRPLHLQLKVGQKTNPDQYKGVLTTLPAGKMSTAEDQANAVVFLCSDLAKSISGVTLAVDGGYTAGNMQQ